MVTILAIGLTSTAYAATTKYTFNDVQLDGQTGEIEASVKITKKSEYSTCSYYTDDYVDYLGYYEAPVSAGDTSEEVLEFCLDNFENRNQ